jgi:ribosomal protein L21E
LYNTSFHSSLQCSPFKALYVVEPPLGIIPTLKHSDHQDVFDILKERQLFNEMLREQLQKAQSRMKLYADAKRPVRAFQVGDKVLLKLQPYTQVSVVSRPYPKLTFKYFGPYTVLEKIGSVAYKIQLPAQSKIHNVFHVSQLKDFTPDYSPVFSKLPLIPSLDIAEVTPEQVLEHRLVKKGNVAVTQVLVKWSHFLESSATWEDFSVLRQRFPSAPAYDQVDSSKEGSVTAIPEPVASATNV